jgi:hypothetical protein
MKRGQVLACLVGLFALMSFPLAPAHADLFDPQTMMKVDEIQPGMRGVGKSVFRGTKPEPFGVTVLGVFEKFDIDADVIIIRVDSGPPITEEFGVAQGMSGSPIYVNGKLIGALAWAFGSFPKKPICGVTPIEQMIDTVEPRSNAPAPQAVAGSYRPRRGKPLMVEGRRVDEITLAYRKPASSPLKGNALTMTPVATPLMVHGLPQSALKRLEKLLEPYNVLPVMGPGRASKSVKTPPLEPGSAIGVSLARGDMDFSGVGTLTCILKDGTVLGFGHPMMGLGSTDLPLTGAYVHGVFGSGLISFKLATPLSEEVGIIHEDRAWSIGGKTGKKADMLGADFIVSDKPRNATRRYHVDIFRQKLLTPLLLSISMDSAIASLSSSFEEGSQRSQVRIEAEGFPPIERDNLFSTDSSAMTSFFSRGGSPTDEITEVISLFTSNRFREVKVNKVSATVEMSKEKRTAAIESVTPSRTRVKPGEKVELAVRLRRYGQPTQVERLTFQVPENNPAGPLQLAVAGGQNAFFLKMNLGVRPPTPTTLQQMVDLLRQDERNDRLYLIAAPMSFGIEVSGQKLNGLPQSITEIFRFSNPATFRQVRDDITQSQPMNTVISGGQVVNVLVEPEEREKVGVGTFGMEGYGGFDSGMGQRSGFMPDEYPGSSEFEQAPQSRLQWLKQAVSLDGQLVNWSTGQLGNGEMSQNEPIDPLTQSRRLGSQPKPSQPESPKSEKVDPTAPPKMPTWEEVQAIGEGEEPAATGGASSSSGRSSKGPMGRAPTTWVQSAERDFAAGKTQGAAVTSDGKVILTPALEPKAVDTQLVVFSQATDSKGNLYLGTWIEGQILRVNPEGKTEVLTKTTDPAITAIVADAQGNVYAGCAPSGVIYKVGADGKSAAWCNLPEPYVWAIELDGKGNAYAATGPNGRVYKVTADGKCRVALETPDRHVLALASDKSGNVYAGTYPRGKVYRISADGNVSTFYETPARYAVQSLAVDNKGNLYVGTSGFQARVFKVEPDGEVKELLKGTRERHVYAMASDGVNVYVGTGPRGKIYRLRADETVATLAQPDDLYITTLANHSGTLFVATASAGRVLQLPFGKAAQGAYISSVKDVGTIARWGVVRWQASGGNDARVAFQTRTGNTAYPDKTWSDWSPQVGEPKGSRITSPPGRYVQYRANLFAMKPDAVPALERVEIVYMTKNRPPQLTLKSPAGGEIWSGSKTINWSAQDPDKDKLTFQVFFSKDDGKTWEEIKGDTKKADDETGDDSKDKSDASASPDKPTVPDEFKDMIKPVPPSDKERKKGRKGEGEKKEGQSRPPSSISLFPHFPYFRSSRLQNPGQPTPPGAPTAPTRLPGGGVMPPGISEPEPPDFSEMPDFGGSASSRVWDTKKMSDGVYLIKVTVTDKISNPKDALTDEKISRVIIVDNTAPQVTLPELPKEKPTKPLLIKVSDATSHVASAEYRVDNGEWFAAATVDGVFDSANEELEIPAADLIEGKHTLEIRVRDAANNEKTEKLEYTWGKVQPS